MKLSRRGMLLGAGATGVAAVGAGALLNRAAPPTSRGAGVWTSFGTVALVGWSRRSLAGPVDHEAGHEHAGGDEHTGSVLVPSAVHGAWTDAATVDLRVHNGSQEPIELSPGQFRVRAGDEGMTVSLYSADRPAGPVPPGSTAALRIDYLVPPEGTALALEFADALSDRTHDLGRLEDAAQQAHAAHAHEGHGQEGHEGHRGPTT
jgi:hypothetical protein